MKHLFSKVAGPWGLATFVKSLGRGGRWLLPALAGLAACTYEPEWRGVALPRQSRQGWSATWAAAADSAGGVYLVGSFTDTINFGGTQLVSAGLTDAFVAKWNPAQRSFEWALRAGGEGHDAATAVAAGPAGVFVAGSFQSYQAIFGVDTLANTPAEPETETHWHSDGFVSRVALDGLHPYLTWTQQVRGPGDETLTALALRGRALYVAGNFLSPALMLADTILPATRPADPMTHGFVAALQVGAAGTRLRWARRLGGRFSGTAAALAVQDAEVFVAGGFQGEGLDLASPALPMAQQQDAYVLKLHDQGRRAMLGWARTGGGPGMEQATALVVRGRRVYWAGSFQSPVAQFGSHQLVNADSVYLRLPWVNSLAADIFVAALDDDGPTARLDWARAFGGREADRAAALALCGSKLLLAGEFRGDSLRLDDWLLRNPARRRIEEGFLLRLADKGAHADCVWATRVGGPKDESITALFGLGRSLFLGGIVTDSARLGPVRVQVPDWQRRAFLAELYMGP